MSQTRNIPQEKKILLTQGKHYSLVIKSLPQGTMEYVHTYDRVSGDVIAILRHYCPELFWEGIAYNEDEIIHIKKMLGFKLSSEVSYPDYLKSKIWQSKRKIALQRAGYACQICNASDTELHVHHRTYANIFDERIQDLTVLCHDCHQLFHENAS